jgi:hypothetical protein
MDSRHGAAPSDLSCDVFLSITHLAYIIVVNIFESRYNLVLIRLIGFLESEELANSSFDDKTAFPPINPPSFVVTIICYTKGFVLCFVDNVKHSCFTKANPEDNDQKDNSFLSPMNISKKTMPIPNCILPAVDESM